MNIVKLFGKAGCGKSATLQMIVNSLEEAGIMCHEMSSPTHAGLLAFKLTGCRALILDEFPEDRVAEVERLFETYEGQCWIAVMA